MQNRSTERTSGVRFRHFILSPVAVFGVAALLPVALQGNGAPVVYAQAPVAVIADGCDIPPGKLARMASRTLTGIEERLNIRLRKADLTVRVCGNDAAYQRAGGLGNTDACYLCPSTIVLRRPRSLSGDLAHEFAHVLIHERTAARCPAWLEEGIVNHENHITPDGQYTEIERQRLDSALRNAARADRNWDLESLCQAAQESHTMDDAFYGAAWSASESLYRTYGREAVLKALDDMAAFGVDGAFQRRFGVNVSQFETAWKASL
ncbi:MAG TPA: hypothetical protein VGM37_04195 [Armatimonadota bacterium]|jgi:hypothetical protein